MEEHADVLEDYVRTAQAFSDEAWRRAPAPGRWSAAALTLHVADAYQFGHAAASGGSGMRLRVPALVAFVSRTVVFPVMLWRKRFPREAPAPSEVHPDLDLAHTLTRVAMLHRLRENARQALDTLQRPDATRVTHAYFGSLSPYQTVRLLTAHTRHHTTGLRERLAAGGVPAMDRANLRG